MITDFQDFNGFWQLERHITHDNGSSDHFIGLAQFMGEGDEFKYREKGEIVIKGKTYNAERKYIWRSAGKLIQVYFDDERFFHEFSIDNPVASHFCPPDNYQVQYIWGEGRWTALWQVQGPRKSYQSKTVYTRAQ